MTTLRVEDIMSKDLVTLKENESLNLAHAAMHLARIRHLPVVNDTGRLMGVVTHRDLLRAQGSALNPTHNRKRELAIPAHSIMQKDVETMSPQTTALEAAKRLYAGKIGCLPVVENERLVGIVTEADFVRLAIEKLGGRV